MRVLFFSRGRGRGHAVPDLAIAEVLLRERPQFDLNFVSYGTGAATLRMHGQLVTDLGLSDDNPFVETLIRCLPVIEERKPQFVVSHEEFAAIPAAKAFGVPSAFLSDWFPRPGTIWFESIGYAKEFIFLDDAGYYDEPLELNGKVTYTGPVLRRLLLPNVTRKTLKQNHLGVSDETLVLLVVPGGAASSSEAKAPLADLVVDAFDLLSFKQKTLVWVADADEKVLRAKVQGRQDVRIVAPHADIEKTMLASDVALTKANRITTLELSALGVPSISISYGLNAIDDYRVARIPTNDALRARGLTPLILSERMMAAFAKKEIMNRVSANDRNIGIAVTRLISMFDATGAI